MTVTMTFYITNQTKLYGVYLTDIGTQLYDRYHNYTITNKTKLYGVCVTNVTQTKTDVWLRAMRIRLGPGGASPLLLLTACRWTT